jgi:DNA-nicking Smr family endonuclease
MGLVFSRRNLFAFPKGNEKMGLIDILRSLFRQTTAEVQPTLDLHGLSVKESLRVTAEFVDTSFRAGISPIRIVYGKGLNSPGGRGILRDVIPRWCEKEGKNWIDSYQREVDLKGGDGSILLYLKKKTLPSNGCRTTGTGTSSIPE